MISPDNGVSALSAAVSYSRQGAVGEPVDATRSMTAFEDMISTAIDSMKVGEKVSSNSINGGETEFTVVRSILGAQRALQSAIAIRDRIVSAVQELSHMSI